MFGKPKTPEQQIALAQSLMQQSQTPQQGQMVGGRYVSSGLAGALAQLGKGYLGGRLQDVANTRQQEQSSALTQALMGENPREALADLTDNPMAQQAAQKMALQQAMQTTTKLIKGEEIGAAPGSVFQLGKDGYQEVYAPTAPKMPPSFQEYQLAQTNPAYAKHLTETNKQKAPKMTQTVGGSDQSAFFTQSQKDMAGVYTNIVEGGFQAQKNLGQIQRLEGLLSESGSGFLPAAKVFLSSNFGVDLGEEADAGTAAKAIVQKMVMEGRPPDSGVFTDADATRLEQTLPNLMNQPGGDKLIIQTLRNISQYDVARSEIAQKAQSGEISLKDANKMMLELEDPMRIYDAARNLPEDVTIEMFLKMDAEDREPFL